MFLFNKKKLDEPLPPDEKSGEARYVKKYPTDEEGKGVMVDIIGEKYPMRGQPTQQSLGRMELIKSLFDKLIQGRLSAFIIHEIPYERLSKPTRAIADAFDEFIEAEKLRGHKKQWEAYKKVFVYFFENDLAYRLRFQWLFERLAKRLEAIKLDEGDKYWLRPKNFRVDLEEEWQEALKKYPQLKGDQQFKDFLNEGWTGKNDEWRLEPIIKVVEHYLEKKL